MIDVLKGLIDSLNLVEVHGERNLALLYNAISTLKQLYSGLTKNKEDIDNGVPASTS